MIQWGFNKEGILHDGSSIETGETSIIPPVDVIFKKKATHAICKKKVLLEVKVLLRPRWFSSS